MSGCGRVTREGLEPTLKSSLPYMERKEKQRKFKLGTQQIILNRDNWTSLRWSKRRNNCFHGRGDLFINSVICGYA